MKLSDIFKHLKRSWPIILGLFLTIASVFLIYFHINQTTTYVYKTQIQITAYGKLKSSEEVYERVNQVIHNADFANDCQEYIASQIGEIVSYEKQKLEIINNKYSPFAYVKSSSENEELPEIVSNKASEFIVYISTNDGQNNYSYASLLEGAKLVKTNKDDISGVFIRYTKYTYIGSIGLSLVIALSTEFLYFIVDKKGRLNVLK